MNLFEFLHAEATDNGLRAEIHRDLYGAYEGAFGGFVAALSLAASRRVADGRRPVALDARFLRRLQAGAVHAEATVVRHGRALSVIDVAVKDAEGVLCATASTSFIDTAALENVDDAAMVRPGASVAYAEATPFQLRRRDVPIVGTLGPRVALTSPDLVATVLLVPWEEPGTAPEAACLAADMSVGPPVDRDVEGGVAHPNADLSLRFCATDAGPEIAGVTRLERIAAGVATVRIEVFSGVELLAVGCASSLLLSDAGPLAVTESEPEHDEAPVTEPAADTPHTDSPDTDSPDTDTPHTDSPDTDSPDTDSPDTDSPDTDDGDSQKPDTENAETTDIADGDTEE